MTLDNRAVRYVSDTGQRHQVFAVTGSKYRYIHDIVASGDGRSVAVSVFSGADRGYDRVVVRRILRPATVAARSFADPVAVASMTGHRALLVTDATAGRHHRLLTRWWNLDTGRLRLLDDPGVPGAGFDAGVQGTADLTAGQMTLIRDDHERVVTIPRRSGRAWSTSSHEWVLSWSPGDRYVLTASWTPKRPRDGIGWDTYRVRRASDGRVIARYDGYENLLGREWTPVWQDASTFDALVATDCGNDSCLIGGAVRCTVHAVCEQEALPAGTLDYGYQERRLPPS